MFWPETPVDNRNRNERSANERRPCQNRDLEFSEKERHLVENMNIESPCNCKNIIHR